jgi:hypothetical protein
MRRLSSTSSGVSNGIAASASASGIRHRHQRRLQLGANFRPGGGAATAETPSSGGGGFSAALSSARLRFSFFGGSLLELSAVSVRHRNGVLRRWAKETILRHMSAGNFYSPRL